MNAGHCLVGIFFQGIFNLLRLKYCTPFFFQQGNICSAALQNLCQQIAESAEGRDQYLVARADRAGQHCLQTASGCGIYQICLVVLCLEHIALHFHSLIHQCGKLRVKLSQDMCAHGA